MPKQCATRNGANHSISNRTAVAALAGLAATVLLALPAAPAAQIAQRHPYQKTLRDYIATLKEADFAVQLQSVKYVDAYFRDLETAARYWTFFLGHKDADIPSNIGIRMSPKVFTLAAIETGDGVNIGSGRGAAIDAKDMAWWAQWEYPGNPYLGSKPVKLRAFVAAAVDMIMQDEDHDNGRSVRSDYLGGSMLRWSYTYRVVKDALPKNVQEAYVEGLVRMVDKLEKMTPMGMGGSDMEFFQLSSMWYAADALGGGYHRRALDRALVVINKITSKTGYEKHGGAFDVSYQGIALRFLTWGALLFKDAKVTEALHKMIVLKAHLTFPEPNGKLFGPTHFSTGTALDAPTDQWAALSRDFAMSMLDDMALYTIWARMSVPDEAKLRAAVKAGIEGLGGAERSDATPAPWKENHWNEPINYAYEFYKPGFYQRLVELGKTGSPLTKPLYARNENFIRDLNGGGEFLAARFDDYAVVIHTGATALNWATGVSGKSGGCISAFWTPQCGTAILGRGRATQSEPTAADEWTDENKRGPYTWAVHAITGRGPYGHYFSTARIRDFQSKYEIDGTKSATVTITGDLSGSDTGNPQGDLKGSALYSREIKIDKKGVAVSSGLMTGGKNKFPELWEMIPIHCGPSQAEARIDLRISGEWRPATETPYEADQIRIARYGKAVYIVLEKPRHIRLNSTSDISGLGGASVRNIMIDLADVKSPPAVKYRITTAP